MSFRNGLQQQLGVKYLGKHLADLAPSAKFRNAFAWAGLFCILVSGSAQEELCKNTKSINIDQNIVSSSNTAKVRWHANERSRSSGHCRPLPRLPSSLMFDYPTMKEVANRIVELSIENA